MVTTRSKSKTAVPETSKQIGKKKPANNKEFYTSKQIGKKKPKAFYTRGSYARTLNSDALDIFLDEDESLNNFRESHKNQPKTAPIMPKTLIMAAIHKWRSMTDIAPYVERAARKKQEMDEAIENSLRMRDCGC